ncbi:transcriptional regulator, TetR family protein [Roseobacter sp. SK209-2-6]|uniref:TetR/AcrR family transcriptional regulator n=1 Tax=Roseobacter sp. SK209-2-6 TaxID=388739 RepID=UPI0000F3F602|nr:TetR/AcrR family transcriptional regulator [Roseobacter sp. SK209-2-6]EBA18062.1 transcriptional regulator, TetR family protein [Roseobacter sp. SK209-2-6]
MASKAEQRRAELRETLVAAAERRIREEGAGALRARDLAKDAGCAVGAIYNAFEDLNAIVLAVNGQTFRALGAQVAKSVVGAESASPQERLVLMSHAYLAFAAENTQLWRALFDVNMPADGPVPDWYMEELDALFAHIAKPVSEIFPKKGPADLQLMVRALFSSVHGIVLLGLENRISGVPRSRIEEMISQVLIEITKA